MISRNSQIADLDDASTHGLKKVRLAKPKRNKASAANKSETSDQAKLLNRLINKSLGPTSQGIMSLGGDSTAGKKKRKLKSINKPEIIGPSIFLQNSALTEESHNSDPKRSLTRPFTPDRHKLLVSKEFVLGDE